MKKNKRCSKCGIRKSVTKFQQQNDRRSGRRSSCKKCANEAYKKWCQTKSGLITKIYRNHRARCRKKGDPLPDYTRAELKIWIESQKNFQHIYDAWSASGFDRWLVPSVDRADDSKPYQKSNLLRICTFKENAARFYRDAKNCESHSRRTPVSQFDCDGKFIKHHLSIASAARVVGGYSSGIVAAAKGRLKTHKGFIWRYCD